MIGWHPSPFSRKTLRIQSCVCCADIIAWLRTPDSSLGYSVALDFMSCRALRWVLPGIWAIPASGPRASRAPSFQAVAAPQSELGILKYSVHFDDSDKPTERQAPALESAYRPSCQAHLITSPCESSLYTFVPAFCLCSALRRDTMPSFPPPPSNTLDWANIGFRMREGKPIDRSCPGPACCSSC